MKTKIVTVTMAIALISSVGFASNLIEMNVLGRQFCRNNNGHLTGLGFDKNGITYYMNSLAGMPDPSSFFKVQYIVGSDQFIINKYSKETKELIYEGTNLYSYDLASDELRSGDAVLSAKQCGN